MSSKLKKLEGDPSAWKLDEFFENLEKGLDELRKDDPGEEDYFRKYPWKWTVPDAKHPKGGFRVISWIITFSFSCK